MGSWTLSFLKPQNRNSLKPQTSKSDGRAKRGAAELPFPIFKGSSAADCRSAAELALSGFERGADWEFGICIAPQNIEGFKPYVFLCIIHKKTYGLNPSVFWGAAELPFTIFKGSSAADRRSAAELALMGFERGTDWEFGTCIAPQNTDGFNAIKNKSFCFFVHCLNPSVFWGAAELPFFGGVRIGNLRSASLPKTLKNLSRTQKYCLIP